MQRIPITFAVALGLLLVAGALAALPKPGASYTGFTSEPAYHGGGHAYRAPVGFRVSADGKQLLGFQYASGDCGGMGGPSNPWGNPNYVRKVGTIPVDARGNFSVANVRTQVRQAGSSDTKISLSTISGRFTAAGVATGRITLTVRIGSGSCPDPLNWTFTATAG